MDPADDRLTRERIGHIVYIGPGPVTAAPVTDDTPIEWEYDGLRRRGADLEWDSDEFDRVVLLEYDLGTLRKMHFTEGQARRLHWQMCATAKGGEYLSHGEFMRLVFDASRHPHAHLMFPWIAPPAARDRVSARRPRTRSRARSRRRHGARRASGIRTGTDPGDPEPPSSQVKGDGSPYQRHDGGGSQETTLSERSPKPNTPRPPRPALRLAPPPKAILSYGASRCPECGAVLLWYDGRLACGNRSCGRWGRSA